MRSGVLPMPRMLKFRPFLSYKDNPNTAGVSTELMLKRYKELEQKESDETLVENHWDIYPRLMINENKTNFYDFTIEDFEMLCYNPIKPQLKLELGI